MSRGCVTVVVNGACEWCLLASHSVFPAAENAGAATPRVGLHLPGDFRATMQRDIINRTLRGAENCKEALSALYFVFPFLLSHLFFCWYFYILDMTHLLFLFLLTATPLLKDYSNVSV